MIKLSKNELRSLNGGYFAPAGTTLTARDESYRKYATMAANTIINGFINAISRIWT